jgi:hypothetical protein
MNKIYDKLPNDFHWEKYLEINDDVKQCYPTKEGAIEHYLRDGLKQKRIYKTIHLPKDFEWEIYLALNKDVYTICKSKTSAVMHYENHGFHENRKYKFEQVNMPTDFDWEMYCILNNIDITNKIDAIIHYLKTGMCEKYIYKIDIIDDVQRLLPNDFNVVLYKKINRLEDICETTLDCIKHYLLHGKKQNLSYLLPKKSIPDDFDWVTYLELNTDVKEIFNEESLAKYHYYITGKNENRVYKFYHTPEDFDWKMYLELNETISNNYKTNEYAAKLHYDLFGYQASLPYKLSLTQLPDDFDWKNYTLLNKDISYIQNNDSKAKEHYIRFGKYQNRPYKQQQIINNYSNKFIQYPFLFHKYILNIKEESKNIKYTIINDMLLEKQHKYKLIAHLHCYNISKFEDFYKPYINKIFAYCNIVIVTYSVGEISINSYNCIFIRCLNQGMDIGGKFVCIDFLKQNKIDYNSILFLHSKTDPYIRKLYWEPILNNLHSIVKHLKKDEEIGIYVPPLIYMGDYATIIYKDNFVNPDNVTCKWNFGNSLYLNDIDRYLELNQKNFLFPEGNCFICNKAIAEELYGNKLLYNLLNDKKSVDIVWIKSLYGFRGFDTGNTINQIHQFFKTTTEPILHPNNIGWGAGHEGHADNMYEHSFERIVFKVVEKLKYKIKVLPYKKDVNYISRVKQLNDKINSMLQ